MKREKMQLDFCKGDVIVIICVVMLAVLTGVSFKVKNSAEKGNMVTIYKDGKKIHELSLEVGTEIFVNGDYTNRIVIKDRKAAITESDCPGEDCVHSGWIADSGKSIICLPNRVEIRIEGKAEVDFIVR